MQNGAKANHQNTSNGAYPIHSAATLALPECFKLLFKYPQNKADVNCVTKDGLNALHILLAQLLDLSTLQDKPMENRGPTPPTDEDIDASISNVVDCIMILLHQTKALSHPYLNFDRGQKISGEKNQFIKSRVTMKKIASMTPLQVICSFQTWNAKPIKDELHDRIAVIVESLLSLGVDPNATAAGKDAIPGTVPGSTPPVFLAATRGYHKLIEIFKKDPRTNFLLENKFKQTILHMTLKAGYYNKIIVHGEESGEVNVTTLEALFDEDNLSIRQQMRSIVNRPDSHGNTALHYAKYYPDQSIVVLLLDNEAKLDKNPQGIVNVHPRTIERYFYEECIAPEGEDIDDEEFKIRINYKLFERPTIGESKELEKAKKKAEAWVVEMEKDKTGKKKKMGLFETWGTGKVDAKRLEIFSDMDSLQYLLKHPVLASFLELSLNSLMIRFVFEFVFYLFFVIVLFLFESDTYGLSSNSSGGATKSGTVVTTVEVAKENGMTYYYKISVSMILLWICLGILLIREFYQLFAYGPKRYFTAYENYLEWSIIILVILNLLPDYALVKMGADRPLQRHLAALTLLLAFFQLYFLLVRVIPNTPIPIYVNMFTTVMRTYALILASYFFFILVFAFSFWLIFSPRHDESQGVTTSTATTVSTPTNTSDSCCCNNNGGSGAEEHPNAPFDTISLSLVKTIVMFAGEMDYTDIVFNHWVGYVIWVLFVFLLVIVLMNILNGLAVSDIGKIREEVDKYNNISIVESLAQSISISLLAEEVIVEPNIRPQKQTFMGIPIPGKYVRELSFQWLF